MFFVTGTDTDVGKTLASAWLMLHLGARYWKPVQSGLAPPTDIQSVQAITGLEDSYFFPPAYELTQPLSPHESARRDGVAIDMGRFTLPESDEPIIVEGAGGVMVPLNDQNMVIDLMAHLGLPAILVCRSQLGTINHTLLSLEAMRARGLTVAGIIINGPKTPHNRQALEEFGRVPVIAEIDQLETVNRENLLAIAPEFDVMTIKDAA